MQAVINNIVTQDPDAAAGLADEWLYLALCERDPTGAGKAIAALTANGYSNEGVLFPRAWCEGLVARAGGDSTTERTAFAAARTRIEKTSATNPIMPSRSACSA